MSHFLSIHTLACTSSSFIPNTCLSCSIVCIDHCIHPVVGGHLGCFQFRDNMNSVSMNILGHVFDGPVCSFLLSISLRMELLGQLQ